MQPGCGVPRASEPTGAASWVMEVGRAGNRPLEAAFAAICARAKILGLVLGNHGSPLFAHVPQCSRKQLPIPLSEKA